MLWKINEIKSLKLDGETFKIKDITVNGDLPGQMCPKCGESLHNHILWDVHQMGIEFDCNIVLIHCMACDHRWAVRFLLEVLIHE